MTIHYNRIHVNLNNVGETFGFQDNNKELMIKENEFLLRTNLDTIIRRSDQFYFSEFGVQSHEIML